MAVLKLKIYIESIFDELLHKVSWPNWNELQGSAVIVAIASMIIAVIVYFMDLTFRELMKVFYSIF